MTPQIRHVILDRDGVLNSERSDVRHIHDWSQWQWLPGAREGLALLSRAGVRISIATNQSGIGRGNVTQEAVDTIHAHMLDDAIQAGATIDRVLVCPHAPDAGCTCRKPSPGLLVDAIDASGIPARATLAVGDALRDLQAAWAAGITAVLLRTGKGRATESLLPQDRVEIFDDLRSFAGAMFSSVVPGVAKAT